MAFNFGGLFDQIGSTVSGVIDSIGEGASQYVDAYVAAESQQVKEAKTDPENLNNAQPVKGTRADGSTIVAPTQAAPFNFSVDRQTLVVGGLFVLGIFAISRL